MSLRLTLGFKKKRLYGSGTGDRPLHMEPLLNSSQAVKLILFLIPELPEIYCCNEQTELICLFSLNLFN